MGRDFKSLTLNGTIHFLLKGSFSSSPGIWETLAWVILAGLLGKLSEHWPLQAFLVLDHGFPSLMLSLISVRLLTFLKFVLNNLERRL